MRRLMLLACTILASFTGSSPAMAATPNIVILYADDMGYGDLGVQNPESRIPTPHLDQLAREGLRFTDAHSSSGICTPSRYALLTGRYHWRKFHNIVNSFGPPSFSDEELTLAELLKSRGYRTACIGKWHLGWDWEALKKPGVRPQNEGPDPEYLATDFDWSRPVPGGPLAHGFDLYFGDDVPNYPPYAWIENDRLTATPTVPLVVDPPMREGNPECRPGPMVAGWKLDQVLPELTRRAVNWIGQQRGTGQPFFLYFPWTSPHTPIVPTTEWQGRTAAGGFGDYMAQSDWTAGQVLAALDQHGFRENTLVIFTADNGPERYAYERTRVANHRSMGPLRGLKRDIWEGGHRVPFVVRWPGVVPAGAVSDELLSQIDIFATIAEIVEFRLPETAADDSLSQLAVWRGAAGARSPRTELVHNTQPGRYALRSGTDVLINAPTGAVTAVPKWYDEEHGYAPDPHPAALFRLSTDLSQHQNLIDAEPERVAELRQRLDYVRRHAQRTGRELPVVEKQ